MSGTHLRNLYDEIVSFEIDAQDQPDGVYFRKGPAYVISSTETIKHEGLKTEEKIIEAVGKMGEIAKDASLPWLVRMAVVHYLIGYIHPFYDGNGRISRYISSFFIRSNLGQVPAFFVSHVIKNNLSIYYDAFDICNDRNNYGDLTPFVILFLDLIKKAIETACQAYRESLEKLNYYERVLSDLQEKKYLLADEQRVIFYLIQFRLFAPWNDYNILSSVS